MIARFFACALVVFCLPAIAAFNGSFLDAGGVAKAMSRGAIVWDVRSVDQYRAGHLPGAVNIGHVSEALLDSRTQLFLPIEVIVRRLERAGLDLKREIVVYGGRGSADAYFGQWALDYFGARRAHVFHDGVEGWRAAKRAVSTQDVQRPRVKVRPFANPPLLVTSGDVLARVGRGDVQFVDVRREAEFRGDESETLRGGHIPGAILIPYNLNLVDPDAPRKLMARETTDSSGMALKKTRALKEVYAELDPRKETIVYCHTGIRATMTAAVLARLGFRSVRLYHGSWFEYGNISDAPVE